MPFHSVEDWLWSWCLENEAQAYIDASGRMIVAQDDSRKGANSFREGLALVKEGGKWGYIEKTGKMVISPQFSECGQFVEGLAAVKVGNKWG